MFRVCNLTVLLFCAFPMIASGADYPWMGGEPAITSGPENYPAERLASVSGQTDKFPADLYYYDLVLGTLGSGNWLELATVCHGKGFLEKRPVSASQPVKASLRSGSSFNWGRVNHAFAFGGGHFHSPLKPLPLVEFAGPTKPGPIRFPDVPTLSQKPPIPSRIIDDPKNSLEHRLP